TIIAPDSNLLDRPIGPKKGLEWPTSLGASISSKIIPMKLEGLSLFFPCHNEEANVERVVRDALRVAPQVADTYEIIVVDDGSRDQTSAKVQALADSAPAVRLVRHQV